MKGLPKDLGRRTPVVSSSKNERPRMFLSLAIGERHFRASAFSQPGSVDVVKLAA